MKNPYFFKNAGNTLAGGAAAGFSQNQQGYMPDQFSAAQGAAQGYATGGAYGALAGAVTAPVTQTLQAHRNLNNLDTSVGGSTHDAYGRPLYQGGEISNAMGKLPELDKTASWDSLNLLGLGRKAERKADTLRTGIRQSQEGYNQAEVGYRNRQMQMQDYYSRMNDQSRMYNLYNR